MGDHASVAYQLGYVVGMMIALVGLSLIVAMPVMLVLGALRWLALRPKKTFRQAIFTWQVIVAGAAIFVIVFLVLLLLSLLMKVAPALAT